MMILAIDPGKSGAVVRFNPQLWELEVWRDFKHEYDLAEALREAVPGCSHAVIESVHSMPAQGVASSFTFGYWAGGAVVTCKALGLTIHRPTPQTWQKGIETDKEQSRERARVVFPAYAEFFARKLDHGSADAALMAFWLWIHALKPTVVGQKHVEMRHSAE